jgi:hypothetical protein
MEKLKWLADDITWEAPFMFFSLSKSKLEKLGKRFKLYKKLDFLIV